MQVLVLNIIIGGEGCVGDGLLGLDCSEVGRLAIDNVGAEALTWGAPAWL